MSGSGDPDESDESDEFVNTDEIPDDVRETVDLGDISDVDEIPVPEFPLSLTVVNFRIVGVYLGSVPGTPPERNATGDVTVYVFDNDPSVKQVVDAVERTANRGNITGVSGLRYTTRTTPNGDQILDEVEVDYTQSPKPRRGYPAGTHASASSSIRTHSGPSSATSTTWNPGAGRQMRSSGRPRQHVRPVQPVADEQYRRRGLRRLAAPHDPDRAGEPDARDLG